MSRTKSAFLGTISSQLYTIISILVSLVSVPIILHHLKAEVYGLSVIIFQVTSYLGMFDFGLTAGVERYLAGTRGDTPEDRKSVQRIISTAFAVYAIMGAVVAVAGNLMAPLATRIFKVPDGYNGQVHAIIAVVSVLVGVQFLLRAVSGIFFAHQRQVLSNTLSFVLTISNTVLTIVFIYLHFELWSFVYAQIAVFLINASLTLYLFKKHYGYIKIGFKGFDYALLKEMFAYGFFLFLVGISVQVVFQTDRILIGSFISLTAVSIYSLTTKLPELLSSLLWKITDNAFPAMVELSKGGDASRFASVHDKIMQLTLSLCTAGFWIILTITYPFLKVWVGDGFYAGTDFTLLVTYLYLVQFTYIHVTSVCLNGAGIAKKISYMALAEASLNLGLSLWLVQAWGNIRGVVIATIGAGLLTSAWYIPYLGIKYMRSNVKAYAISVIKPVVICSLFGAAVYFVFHRMAENVHSWGGLVLVSAAVSILCGIPLLLINRTLLLELKNKVLKSRGAAVPVEQLEKV